MAKLICEIELDKAGGVTVTVEDKAKGQLQKMHLDGVKITTQVKTKKGTSTIVQQGDSVKVSCKTFEVSSETITLKAKKKVRVMSQGQIVASSTRDTKVSAKGNLKLAAIRKADLSGAQVSAKGKMKAELSAMQVKVAGKVKTEVAAPMVDMNAKAVAKVAGAIVQTKAKGILQAQSNGIAAVKGSLTNVQGMLVKLGYTLAY